MTHVEAKAIVDTLKKGTIRTITYTRPMKTRKGVTDVIEKTTTMQVRTGVRYDSMKAVKEARADGSIPEQNQGLAASLEWIDNNFIKNTKTGAVMLRVAYANGNKTTTEYRKNGQIVEKTDIAPLCLASETKHSDSAPTVFNIGVDKIISIK